MRPMLSFNGLYEDLDRDGRYDNPGLTIFRQWLQVAPKVIFGPDNGDWWSKIDAGRYLKYQTSLLLRALQGNEAGLPLQFDFFAGRARDAFIVQTIRDTIDELKPQFAGRDMADWRLPTSGHLSGHALPRFIHTLLIYMELWGRPMRTLKRTYQRSRIAAKTCQRWNPCSSARDRVIMAA